MFSYATNLEPRKMNMDKVRRYVTINMQNIKFTV